VPKRFYYCVDKIIILYLDKKLLNKSDIESESEESPASSSESEDSPEPSDDSFIDDGSDEDVSPVKV
jgi:hypothetical protein